MPHSKSLILDLGSINKSCKLFTKIRDPSYSIHSSKNCHKFFLKCCDILPWLLSVHYYFFTASIKSVINFCVYVSISSFHLPTLKKGTMSYHLWWKCLAQFLTQSRYPANVVWRMNIVTCGFLPPASKNIYRQAIWTKYDYPHFANEKTDAHDLPNIRNRISNKVHIKSQVFCH